MNSTTLNQSAAMKSKRQMSRKRIPSILDPFTKQLLHMDGDGKTLNDMLAWLKTQKIETSANNVSKFLTSRRQREQIVEKLDGEKGALDSFLEWRAANPNAPKEALIERFELLAFSLAVEKEATPESLKLADRLAWTASRVANDRSREDYRTRKLVMEEAKHAEWVKCEQARGFEFCLREAKKYPAVVALYQTAFEALEKCRKENGE